MTKRTVKNLSDVVLSEEAYAYDAAGNITDAPDSCFAYDTNNRLTWYNGDAVGYDADGNMLSVVLDGTNGTYFTYDSSNRLISAGGHTYTYNAEDVRIRNLCAGEDTKYTYNTNCRLSKLLCKETNGVTTKYVYGRGLIGEETNSSFTTYHFDCRGSTVALTNASGIITDTFEYDTYGGLISRTGTTPVIFGYNGRDGVVTDTNGLIYMRARYYSPDMRRFINADVVAGAISEAVTLNRFAYANGNPVSNIDPFGLEAQREATDDTKFYESPSFWVHTTLDGLGLIPAFGFVPDLLNGIIYVIEGDWGNAALSGLSALPVVGYVSTGSKWTVKAVKYSDDVVDVVSATGKIISKSDDIIDAGKTVVNGVDALDNTAALVIKNADEVKLPTQIKTSDAVTAWDDFLGNNQTNINKFNGKNDMDRIFSADGTKSIRFANHEMRSIGTPKAHFHYETWDLDPKTNVVTVTKYIQRLK